MKKCKYFAGAILIMVLVFSCSSIQNVDAKTITLTTSKPSKCDFSTAWERTRLVYISGTSSFIGELCYGYNTVAINEDYVWTRSVMYKHKSYLLKSGTTYTSSEKKASSGTTWAKLEKKHSSGVTPTYGIQFTNATSDTDKSDFSLGTASSSSNK